MASPAIKSNSPTLLGCLAICFGFFFLLAMSSWLAIQISIYRSDRYGKEVIARIDAMREGGVPVDNDSFDAWYRTNTDPKDTDAWLQLLDVLHGDEFREQCRGIEEFDPNAGATGRMSEDWPSESRYRELAAHSKEILSQIRTLAHKRAPVRFPIHFDSFNTLLEPIQRLRTAARLVQVECQVAMQDHDSSKVADSIETLLDLSMVVSSGPGLVSHLVGISIRSMAYEQLKQAVQQNLLKTAEHERMRLILSPMQLERDRFRMMMQEERAMALPAFFDVRRYSDGDQATTSQDNGRQLRASYQDIQNYLDFMVAYENLDTKSMANWLEESRNLEKSLRSKILDAGWWGGRDWIMTGVALPAVEAVVTVCCNEVMQHRLALHAIAIRQFESQYKRLPENLLELRLVGFDTNANPPVGDKPMGYMIKDGGAVLWAIHPSEGLETTDEPPLLGSDLPNNERREQLVWDLPRAP